MKTISTAMQTHLEQEVTTLCTCWRLAREDGDILGFTDNSFDIIYDDGDGLVTILNSHH